ncbi:hypothetical protein BGAL_0005g00070 [Botrytis galanthina]|uniref:Uncharacterized protein n=1 Tax=Botrytis galanthina TaxID=278940 RepID=A0A4S8RC18_9HELO|nr:hypothetical protein BGAL_0005g00070 [Botrytis galanthina]
MKGMSTRLHPKRTNTYLVKRTSILANRPHLEVTSSPSKNASELPSIRSILECPTDSYNLPPIFTIAARPPVYTQSPAYAQLPILSEVFPVNQTLVRQLSLAFATVQPLDDDEDSCRQLSTIS